MKARLSSVALLLGAGCHAIAGVEVKEFDPQASSGGNTGAGKGGSGPAESGQAGEEQGGSAGLGGSPPAGQGGAGEGGAGQGGAGQGGTSNGGAGQAGSGPAGAGGAGQAGGGAAGQAGSGQPPQPGCPAGSAALCSGESCCARVVVPAGNVKMGRDEASNDGCVKGGFTAGECDDNEKPEHTLALQAFSLDKYEVSVARFREFVKNPAEPKPDQGTHPQLTGSGWRTVWSSDSLINGTKLKDQFAGCEGHTYLDAGNDDLPINCVDWYQAFAFCIWEGGRLPLEAEWERAAVGDGNEMFPWGSSKVTCDRAQYAGCDTKAPAPVGGKPGGAGPFGHRDLSGNVAEFVLDIYEADFYSKSSGCTLCASVNFGAETLPPATPNRIQRGGSFFEGAIALRAAARAPAYSNTYSKTGGFRCAYDP